MALGKIPALVGKLNLSWQVPNISLGARQKEIAIYSRPR